MNSTECTYRRSEDTQVVNAAFSSSLTFEAPFSDRRSGDREDKTVLVPLSLNNAKTIA